MAAKETLTLLYFNVQGLGARIRIAAAVGALGERFQDRRFADRAEFNAMKLGEELPYGQVPLLLVQRASGAPAVKLAQSSAIRRYVCAAGGLQPADALQAAAVDAALAAEADAFAPLGCAKYRERHGFAALEGAALAAVERALREEVLPRHLGHLERALSPPAAAGGWVAGTERPSAADFAWGTSLRELRAGAHSAFLPADILAPFPRVNAYLDRFLALPEVSAYYAAWP
jgi:glutathione S-transferase